MILLLLFDFSIFKSRILVQVWLIRVENFFLQYFNRCYKFFMFYITSVECTKSGKLSTN